MRVALPYLQLPPLDIGGIRAQPYGICMLAGLVAGTVTVVRQGRAFGIAPSHLGIVISLGLLAAMTGGHVLDVIAYHGDEQPRDPAVWLQMTNGQALFGALFAVAAVTALIARARQIHGAALADVVALGCLVALVLGRLGCALVHDHPGVPTDSVFGVEFPVEALHRVGIDPQVALTTLRVHDVGLEELLVLLPITIAAFVLVRRRRLRAGMIAALGAIAYAVPRFGLDFLRLPSTEPLHGGLTTGQWCCLVTIVIAAIGLRGIARKARYSPLPVATVASQ